MSYFKNWWFSFNDIFNLRNEEAKGRTIILSTTILTALYNVFITGIFYTGFLSMYGISITGMGILTFVPFISNMLCIFSAKILGRFKRRKKILITAKLLYFFMYIIITTVMPSFVTDPDARLVCFVIILIGASTFYAPFSPGFSSWFYNFYPNDNERRARFLLYMQIISSVFSSILVMFSSILADALNNSPYQNTLILCFRYFAFVFVVIECFLQSRVKEYPYAETEKPKLRNVFVQSFMHKKFFYCMLLCFAWSYIVYLTHSLWDYHLLNHLGYSYTLINTMNVSYTILLVMFSPVWQMVLRRFSWIKTFGITILLWFPTEYCLFFLTKDTNIMFIVVRIIQNILLISINLINSNILYINMPEENTTSHIAFYTIGSNIFFILGLMTSTLISSITGDHPVTMFGMEVYSVQFVPFLRGTLMMIMGLVMVVKWRSFSNDRDIADIELYKKAHKKIKEIK